MAALPETFDYQAAMAFLYGRIDYERTARMPYRARVLSLDRMHGLLARLGDPHLRYPIVHVAGTKGKGSTSAMIAAVLTAAGYRTGLYTSPHLERIEERMSIDMRPCPSDDFVRLVQRVRPVVESIERGPPPVDGTSPQLTYFEITTALAMLYFAEQTVEAAVLEVGLGGRLDSTNVCRPEVAVITSISFDHMRQLGRTLAAIAGEKAGIIKPGVPVVSGVTEPEPRDVIERIAAERGCRCYRLGRDFRVTYRGSCLEPDPADGNQLARGPRTKLDYDEPAGAQPTTLPALSVAMLGRHQATNAAVALATVNRLRAAGWRVSEAAMRQGLAHVRCPARAEVLASCPTVIVDAAHNAASIAALINVLQENFAAARRKILLFAASKDKDLAGMLRQLLPHFDVLVLTRFRNNPRAAEPEKLAAVVRRVGSSLAGPPPAVTLQPDAAAAWNTARALASPDDLVCIAGSFFLAAELRPVVVQAAADTARG